MTVPAFLSYVMNSESPISYTLSSLLSSLMLSDYSSGQIFSDTFLSLYINLGSSFLTLKDDYTFFIAFSLCLRSLPKNMSLIALAPVFICFFSTTYFYTSSCSSSFTDIEDSILRFAVPDYEVNVSNF